MFQPGVRRSCGLLDAHVTASLGQVLSPHKGFMSLAMTSLPLYNSVSSLVNMGMEGSLDNVFYQKIKECVCVCV